MNAVVNHLPLKPDADWAKLIGLFEPFFAEVRRQHPKMKAALLLSPATRKRSS